MLGDFPNFEQLVFNNAGISDETFMDEDNLFSDVEIPNLRKIIYLSFQLLLRLYLMYCFYQLYCLELYNKTLLQGRSKYKILGVTKSRWSKLWGGQPPKIIKFFKVDA